MFEEKKGAGTVLNFPKMLVWQFPYFPQNVMFEDNASFVGGFFFGFCKDKCVILVYKN